MIPTPRAEQLATLIRIALDGLQQSQEPDNLIHRGRRPPSASPIDNDASIVLVPLIVAHVARVPPA
jgi:hypothetical protein